MPGGHDDRASSVVVLAFSSAGAAAAGAAAADCLDGIALKVLRIGTLCTNERWPRVVALCKQLLQIIVSTCGGVGNVEVVQRLVVVVLKFQLQKFLGRQAALRLAGPFSECTASLVRWTSRTTSFENATVLVQNFGMLWNIHEIFDLVGASPVFKSLSRCTDCKSLWLQLPAHFRRPAVVSRLMNSMGSPNIHLPGPIAARTTSK